MTNRLHAVDVASATRPLFVGVDVGGTNTKIGLVDDEGRSLARVSIPTEEEKGPEDLVARAAAAIDTMLHDLSVPAEEAVAIGLGTPGTMDIPAGMMLEPPNLPHWRNFPIRDSLSRASGRPVSFANDGNAAAFGEYWVGSGRDYPSIVMLTLGTGVGGGIIIGDLSIDGEHSHGSECGHIIIDYHDDARMCSCGQRGHIEAYASATALVKRAEEALAKKGSSALKKQMTAGDPLTPLLIAQCAEQGDKLSRELVLDTAFYLGGGIVTMMHTVDPAAVILGGAMNFGGHGSPLGGQFLDRVREVVHERTFPVLARHIVIDFASLGGDAGYIGAAGIARAAYHKAKRA